MSLDAEVRRAGVTDVEALLALVGEHAAFERGPPPSVDAHSLASALQGDPPLLLAWLAERAGEVLGYLSATRDYSTWQGRRFLHMDCLYLRPAARGQGLGTALLETLCRHARASGIGQLQWQTPDWNVDAARFYRRHGAHEAAKRRFVLELARG
jgi:GNAT superfamily N-acetyltransferase